MTDEMFLKLIFFFFFFSLFLNFFFIHFSSTKRKKNNGIVRAEDILTSCRERRARIDLRAKIAAIAGDG